MRKTSYADMFMDTLAGMGFTHCFYLAGGNSMHLLEAASRRFNCVPFTHEVSATIAAEYLNASSTSKAFALVTAGPGLTNTITAISGSWLESRELLVVGGQVKSSDLSSQEIRQRGIQEVDGVTLCRSITKVSKRLDVFDSSAEIIALVRQGQIGRKGPVFLEVPLDLSGKILDVPDSDKPERPQSQTSNKSETIDAETFLRLKTLIHASKRPLVLIGQGASNSEAVKLSDILRAIDVPVATTWTGADRIGYDYPNYVGRPNFYGMRSSNLILQKSDLIVALGAGLGLQQTGFNLEEFAPNAQVIQIDIDESQLNRPWSRHSLAIKSSVSEILGDLISIFSTGEPKDSAWLEHCSEIVAEFSLVESHETNPTQFVNPHAFISGVSDLLSGSELVVSCSSGGTFTAFMQAFSNVTGQTILSNKGLASMGYGLAGAIGMSIGNGRKRVTLFEGDGGFVQNLQELGTVSQQNLPIKMFVFDNQGYASIRGSQRNYFSGNYLGCDVATGLGMPNWKEITAAYSIEHFVVDPNTSMQSIEKKLSLTHPVFFQVMVNPEFQYIPRIQSYVESSGQMKSNPLHLMYPPLENHRLALAMKHIR